MPSPYDTYQRRFMTPAQRFAGRHVVDPVTGCWNWTGSLRGEYGYGQFWLEGTNVAAHRAAWMIFRGPIPLGLHVLHRCDNALCVNYETHLFLGTHQDNMNDKVRKGRQVNVFGEDAPTHKLTTEQVLAIRVSQLPGVDLSRMYGVGPMEISRIRRGLRWRHVNA